MEIKNAVIEAAVITIENGFLDCGLTLDYGGGGPDFGGWVLYLPKSYSRHTRESMAGHFIFRVMEIAGVTKWDDLPGMAIRVKVRHDGIDAIGHIIKDVWFCPREEIERPIIKDGGGE